MLSLINGTMEFITESNSLSGQIQIDDTFHEFGRTYKVNNIYYKDGILHVIAKAATNEKPTGHLKILIDGTGKVIFLSDGSVSIKAYWAEKDISEISLL